ncbi:MAG: MoaD family protein [Candidatus Nezhaarchaeales archaeon]
MKGKVKVILTATFREAAGIKEVEEEVGEGLTVKELVERLARRFGGGFNEVIDPKTGRVNLEVLLLLNGKPVQRADLKLGPGDVIMFTVPIAGGR